MPKDAFIALIAELELLGRVQTKYLSGEDVTEEYIDLQALRDALRTAFAGFVGVIRGMIIALGYLIPIIILLGLGWLVKAKLVPKVRRRG